MAEGSGGKIANLDEVRNLKMAVAKVKGFLDALDVESPPNDLIINTIEDRDDLWLFGFNNGWPMLQRRINEYPGCDCLAVFKSDGRLLQLKRSYGWDEGSFEEALADARSRWQRGDRSL